MVGKTEGNSSLVRPRRRWEDMIIDVREIGLENVERMHLAQDRDQW
jgi:hypothetical protein